jgi:hypothetical protein
MGHYKTYISYVVQKGDQHIHESAIAEFPLPKYPFIWIIVLSRC